MREIITIENLITGEQITGMHVGLDRVNTYAKINNMRYYGTIHDRITDRIYLYFRDTTYCQNYFVRFKDKFRRRLEHD